MPSEEARSCRRKPPDAQSRRFKRRERQQSPARRPYHPPYATPRTTFIEVIEAARGTSKLPTEWTWVDSASEFGPSVRGVSPQALCRPMTGALPSLPPS